MRDRTKQTHKNLKRFQSKSIDNRFGTRENLRQIQWLWTLSNSLPITLSIITLVIIR